MSDTDDLTPGKRSRAIKLLLLARTEFGPGKLTKHERKLIRCAAIGIPAIFVGDSPGYMDKLDKAIKKEDEAIKSNKPLPPASDRPVPEAKLSADVVRWLVSDPDATGCIDPSGVRVVAATIKNRLDLAYCPVPLALRFESCVLRRGMVLRQSNCEFIALHRTLLGNTGGDALSADGAKIAGDVFLAKDVRAEGMVRLIGAEIGGDLVCISGRLINKGSYALAADRARVAGDVFLSGGFCSEGEVRLLGAKIGGSLSCLGGRFVNTGGDALNAERADIAGGVSLRDGFRAEGLVKFMDTKIGSFLDCDNGLFINTGGDALNVERANIDGGVYLRGKFCADGKVELWNTTIGGNLNCSGGRFTNANGYALSMKDVTVKGLFTFREHENSAGKIDLRRSEIGTLDDAPNGKSRQDYKWPEQILLSDCRYNSIEAGSPMDARSRLKWLDSQDNTAGADVPNPQPYRHLADVLKKQGHENDARTILRVCANRRILPLAARARGLGPIDPLFYLSVVGLIGIALCGLLVAANHLVASAWVLGVLNVGVVVCLVAGSMNKLRALTGLIEWARVFGTQWSYRLVVGHGYARWRAVAWAFAFFMSGATVFNQNSEQTMQPAQAVALRAFTDIDRKPVENKWVKQYPKFDPVVYSADTLLPLVSFHQEDHWTPSGHGRWGWIVKNIYLPFHIAMGWVIATLFVASFTRLMRQEG